MENEKTTIKRLQEMKARKETITMLSAYDYPLLGRPWTAPESI